MMSMDRKFLLLCFVLATAACAAAIPTNRWDNDRELNLKMLNPEVAFEEWVEEHAAPFMQGTEEWSARYAIWLENLHKAVDHNSLGASHWLTMNKFAALSQEEFHRHYLGKKKNFKWRLRTKHFRHASVDLKHIPSKMDWREKNVVTPVKDQGTCGACWTFAATGAIEGINAIHTGNLTSLSEQELMDCDTIVWDEGCDGGYVDTAFTWIIDNGGLSTEEDYPYEARSNTCNVEKRDQPVVSIDAFEDCPVGQESLLKAVSQQPVSVSITGGHLGVQLYGGGIYDSNCEGELNHAVLVVGYSLEPPNKYFLVKNSWGLEWGERGYMKLALDKNGEDGQCGVAMEALYPVKTHDNPTPSPPAPGPTPAPEPPSPIPAPEPRPPQPPTPPRPQLPCDAFNECAQGETCCCVTGFFGLCFEYGCCPFKNAVCCPGGMHCCPVATPVCNTSSMECTAADSSFVRVPIGRKRPADRVFPWSSRPSNNGRSEPRHRLQVS